MDADNAKNIALHENTPTQAESLPQCVELAAGIIEHNANANKMEYMCINKKGDISSVNGGSTKLVDKITQFGSSITSTENEINMRQSKAWTATHRLSIIRKSNLSDKIKRIFSTTALYGHRLDDRDE